MPKAVVLRVPCSNQWHQPYLGNCEKCRFLGSPPDLLSLTLQCLFKRAPKGSWCGPHLEDHCPHSLRSAPPSENTWDLFLIFKRLIYLWLCWVFIAVRGLSLVIACRGFSLAAVCGLLIAVASHCSDFSVRSTNSKRAGSGLVVQT